MILIKLDLLVFYFRNGTGRSVGTERVRVGGRSVFRRTIFQKIRIRDFFEKCFKRDGTERVGRDGTGRKRYCNQSDGKDIVIRKIW